jgi:hypothetical protein
MIDALDTVAEGRLAWQRIREHGRRNFDDWICVARALAIGRTAALKAAKTNKCVGSRYNREMGIWLTDRGLDGVVAQERYRALLVLEHLDAISAFRAGLDEAQRRRLNHPNSVWFAWKRSIRTGPPRREHAKKSSAQHRPGRPVFWPQDFIRRGAEALRKCRSPDLYAQVRAVLEGAVPTAGDIAALLETKPTPQPALSSDHFGGGTRLPG